MCVCVCVCVCVCARVCVCEVVVALCLLLLEVKMATRVQILYKAVCLSQSTNTLGNVMNLITLSLTLNIRTFCSL